jgi:hypothetical protein
MKDDPWKTSHIATTTSKISLQQDYYAASNFNQTLWH